MNDRSLGWGLVLVGLLWLLGAELVVSRFVVYSPGGPVWEPLVRSLHGWAVGLVYVTIGMLVCVLFRTRDPDRLTFQHAVGMVGITLAPFVGLTLAGEFGWSRTVVGFTSIGPLESIRPLWLVAGTFAAPSTYAAYCVAWLFAVAVADTTGRRLGALLGMVSVPVIVAVGILIEGQIATLYLFVVVTVPLYSLLYGLPLVLAGHVLGLERDRRDERYARLSALLPA